MKKTVIVTAIAFCLSIATTNANSETNYENNVSGTHMLVTKVSPFCLAIAKGDFNTVKKLIELGTDVNKKSDGMTPAMYAARFNRADILELLITKGAKLQVKSDRGLTAKDYADISQANDVLLVINKTLERKA